MPPHSCLLKTLVYNKMGLTSRSAIRTLETNILCKHPQGSSAVSCSSILMRVVACVVAFVLCFVLANTTRAQWTPWKITTPRDTLFVPADQPTSTLTHLTTQLNVSTKFYFSGTFGVFPWQHSSGFDARYLFSDSNWNARLPLANPPTWGNTNYQVYLQISNNGQFSISDSLRVAETGYQSDHDYTAIYPGAGDFFYFRIYDQLNTDPSGSDYKLATGGITIRTAQYTAGISVQFDTLAFPTTNVGLSSILYDSIASYGIDPLEVDSVWIDGPQSSDFSFQSQRGSHFALDSVAANRFGVSYTPSAPEVPSIAYLHIRSSNTDPADRTHTILLTGYSAAPNGTIGPSELDFGTVRAQEFSSRDAIVFNSGNATYYITRDTIIPSTGTPAGIFWTSLVTPDPVDSESGGQIQFNFVPDTNKSYQATAYLWDSEGKLTKILLTGNGAIPDVVSSDSVLDFDTVFTDDTKVLSDTITNVGNWTSNVVLTKLGCQNPNWFSFDPPDTSFYLDAGQSRIYTITFRPATTISTPLNACLNFYFDDGSQPLTIDLNGYEKQRQIKYDTNVVNFGRVKVGDSRTQRVMVDNQSFYSTTFIPWFDTSSQVFRLSAPSQLIFPTGPNDSIQLLFQPAHHGPASAMIHLRCTNDGQSDSIYMFGFGAVAQPVFNPPIIDFGTVRDATSNYHQTTVSDTGDYPLAICSLDIVGPDSSEFSLVSPPNLPDTVADSGMSKLILGFNFTTNAHTGGVHHATLQIHYCDGSMDTLPLLGTEATASIQFCYQEPIDFGNVRVGTKRDTGICFGNTENIAQTIGKLWITPANAPFFTKDLTASVPPNGQYYDTVGFGPIMRGAFSGWLHGSGNGMTEDSIPFTGMGMQSVPLLSTHTLNFGYQRLRTTSNPPMQLTLRDTGDWPLAVELEKTGDPDSEFTVTLQTSATVDTIALDSVGIGETSTYFVTFTPRFPKLPDHESKLVFHYDGGIPSDTVILIGKDRTDFLSFDRDTIQFGLVRVGTVPSPTAQLNLLNTSNIPLSDSGLQQPGAPFTINPSAPIIVDSGSLQGLTVTFAPQAIGPVQRIITGQGSSFVDSIRDTVVLAGIGAAPLPKLSVDTLDFDTVALGRVITRSFTLTNAGNWPLIVSCGPITGPNAPDFADIIPADSTIDTNGTVTYSVTFTSLPPVQLTPRLGYIVWTLDDGTTDTLVLIAHDVPPLRVQLGFPHAYFGRPGDKIAAALDLQTAIPDSLQIDTLSGVITYDPTMVDLKEFGAADTSLKLSSVEQPGSLIYGLHSDSVLTNPKPLITLSFQLHTNLQEGASSPLIAYDTLPSTQEAVATEASTTIFLDSICGTIHLLAGSQPIASFIEQNVPNPVGGATTSTTVPFNIGDDNTIVTIRLLDPTGREALRPVDHIPFARGRYQITIDGGTLHSGIYFYEFQAEGQPVQMLKMAVE